VDLPSHLTFSSALRLRFSISSSMRARSAPSFADATCVRLQVSSVPAMDLVAAYAHFRLASSSCANSSLARVRSWKSKLGFRSCSRGSSSATLVEYPAPSTLRVSRVLCKTNRSQPDPIEETSPTHRFSISVRARFMMESISERADGSDSCASAW